MTHPSISSSIASTESNNNTSPTNSTSTTGNSGGPQYSIPSASSSRNGSSSESSVPSPLSTFSNNSTSTHQYQTVSNNNSNNTNTSGASSGANLANANDYYMPYSCHEAAWPRYMNMNISGLSKWIKHELKIIKYVLLTLKKLAIKKTHIWTVDLERLERWLPRTHRFNLTCLVLITIWTTTTVVITVKYRLAIRWNLSQRPKQSMIHQEKLLNILLSHILVVFFFFFF